MTTNAEDFVSGRISFPCRVRRVLVEVQAIRDGGRNLSWQPVGRREVGFGFDRGGSPFAGVDPTSVHVEQPNLIVQFLRGVEDDFRRQRAHVLLRCTSQREVAPESPPQCRQSRYGMRGVRIEESSHPGPWSSDNVGGSRPEEEFLDQFQRFHG